jgi:polysaccharide chain length determinant protein (PEP-CTERM system associated)
MDEQQGIQIQRLAPLVRRRLPLALSVAGVVFLASIVLAALLPNEYEAYSTILVQPQSISEKLVEPGVKETQLNRRLNLMTSEILSRARLSRIIDELELYEDESATKTREEVILMMRDRIDVVPILPELTTGNPRNEELVIDTFRIFFRDRSAKNAAAVANRLANDFIEEHIRERVRKSGDSSEFIEAELQRLEARSREVEAQIAAVAEENAGRLPSDLSTNQRLLERALDMLRMRQIELAQSQSDAEFYEGQETLQNLAAGGGGGDAAGESPERQIELLEIKLAEHRARGFTSKHPDVVTTQQQIEEHRRALALISDEPEDGEEQESGGGLAAMASGAEKRRAALKAEAAQRDIDRLLAEIDEIEQRIADTPRVQEQIATLQREYRHLVGSTAEFADRRLVASVSADMERRQKGEQFRVLESAFVPPDPFKPNRLLIVVMGGLLGMAIGAGTGVLRETTDVSFHAARDVQAALRIPVLAAIPGIMLEADRRARRRRRVWIGLATSVLVGVVLTGSAAGYMYVNGVPGFVASILAEEAAPPAAAPATPEAVAPESPSAGAGGPPQG